MTGETKVVAVEGLTLRDWFAGQVLAGLIAYKGSAGPAQNAVEVQIKLAYDTADSVLKYRAAERKHP